MRLERECRGRWKIRRRGKGGKMERGRGRGDHPSKALRCCPTTETEEAQTRWRAMGQSGHLLALEADDQEDLPGAPPWLLYTHTHKWIQNSLLIQHVLFLFAQQRGKPQQRIYSGNFLHHLCMKTVSQRGFSLVQCLLFPLVISLGSLIIVSWTESS